MRTLSILFIFLLAVTSLFAQKGKVNIALSNKEAGKLDKALAAIEEAIDATNPKTESSINWPRTWEVRGEIYQAVFQSKDENYKKLYADPLAEAFKSYLKAIELDTKNKFSNSVRIKLQLLIQDLISQAETAFNTQNYDEALASFEQILAIEDTPVYKAESPNLVDTVIIYNAALTAYSAKKFDKAIGYYKMAAKYKYNGAQTYERLSESYLSKKDTVGALEVMQQGLTEYPGNSAILVQLINIYEKVNRLNDAMKYLDMAISNEPNNDSFYLFRGILLDRMKNPEEAIKSYLKAIELKSGNFDALFNLGILYYNLGVIQIDVANAVPSNQSERYEAEKVKADLEFKKALPYLEKAYELKTDDRSLLEALKNVYYRLQMLDKYEAMIESMKKIN
ncbi:MAG: tetratricopeptide repeat protein [Prolixibacteraceae bacterium]|nr:tetratricopeptide repeat protein [Prolixibacteraceae bacterium]